jgi:hypothetical protein
MILFVSVSIEVGDPVFEIISIEVGDPVFEIQDPTTIDVFNANNSNDNDDVSNLPSFQSFKVSIFEEASFITFIHEH